MISAVHVERLRGIRTGRLSELTPLTVLVGPSGAGKSTILDALLIAAGGAPGDAIGRVVRRRAELPQGGPWLFERRQPDARIVLEGDDTGTRACELSWSSTPSEDLVRRLPEREQERHPIEIGCDVTSSLGHFRSRTVISVGNEYRFDLSRADAHSDVRQFRDARAVRLVEPAAGANHAALHRVFSDAAEQGRLDVVIEIVREALDGVVDLRVLTVEDAPVDQPILHLDYATHSVPVAGAGSGIYALVRLALELAALPGGLVLVEEPEIHQHPAGIHRTARVLHAATRRDIQVVVSTHSLELIDSLVATATQEDLDRLCVMRVVLDRGMLRSSRFPGPMIATARRELDEDLR
ncbi:AAA family ATPase [Sorangium sp. So ce281]|uniref:ATP-binding protein n=1 Tax=unclassified Sorangium TaxID=2621164 RepID=UPI003F63F38A